MKNDTRSRVRAVMGSVVLGMAIHAGGADLTEYFNGYGASQVNGIGLNGGTGWASAYTYLGSGDPNSAFDYVPNIQVSPTVTGYASTGNVIGSTNGAAGKGGTETQAARQTGALTGTIWISAAYRLDGAANQFVRFWLDANSASPANHILIRCNSTGGSWVTENITYGGTVYTDDSYKLLAGDRLVIIRVVINENGSNDRLTVWTRPADVSSVAALGTPDFDMNTVDAFGDALNWFGFNANSGGTGNYIDSIRISNEAYGFTFVTTGEVAGDPVGGTVEVQSVVLKVTGYTGGLQWQKSANGSTWENVPGALASTLDVTSLYTNTPYFRTEVTFGAGTTYSTRMMVTSQSVASGTIVTIR